MTILWTKCSERMPPDNTGMLIARNVNMGQAYITNGKRVRSYLFPRFYEWAPCTPEAWASLNHKTD